MILYRTKDDNRKLTKVITKLADINSFKIKDDVSVLAPIVRLSNSHAIEANYCYLKKFKRYYYIREAVVMNDDIVELHCEIDVLQTYRDYILNLNTFIERQEFNYSPYVTDSKVITQSKREIRYDIIGNIGTATGSYIALTVSGGTDVE